MNAGSGASKVPRITRARAYLIAIAATAVAVVATLPLQRTFERFPYLPLLVGAVIVSTWVGGLGPGLVAAGAGAVAAEYLVMGGLHAVGRQPELLAQVALFVAVAAVVTSIRASSARVSAAGRNQLMWELQERVKELTLLHRATIRNGLSNSRSLELLANTAVWRGKWSRRLWPDPCLTIT